MEMAGAGHVNMFNFWYKGIVKNYRTCDLEARNKDGRNLWSIAGLAHEDGGDEKNRKHVHHDIKAMVKHLAELRYMKGEGLATHSRAHRGDRRRIEGGIEDEGLATPSRAQEAASSSSKRPASPKKGTGHKHVARGHGVESRCLVHLAGTVHVACLPIAAQKAKTGHIHVARICVQPSRLVHVAGTG